VSGRGRRHAVALGAMWVCASHAAAVVVFTDGWMRPVTAGAPSAEAYVDVRADSALTLVAVRTDIARTVDLVAAPAPGPAPEAAAGAGRFMLAPGEKLRFARHGNVLRLRDIVRTVDAGDTVQLEFAFEDASRRVQSATATIVVRGVTPPGPARAAQGAQN
jgi:copper(I)-binding protein